MSYRLLLPQTATIIRRTSSGTVDRYGDPTEVEAAGVEYPARLEQQSRREAQGDRETQVEELRLYLPASAAGEVDGTDRVEVEGAAYEVVGPPLVAYDRRRVHHVEARLRRAAD